MFSTFVFSFLVFECNLVFIEVGSCAKLNVLSQLIVFLVLFYASLQLVYFQLVYFNIFMLIGNSLTNIQVLLVVF